MSIESVMPSNHLILCRPLLSLCSIFHSMRLFSNESTLCNPMDCSTPGLPVHHQLTELASTHVNWVSDAIQPSHPLSSIPFSCLQSCPASGSFPMSRFFTLIGQNIGASVSASASVLPMNTQDLFSFRVDWLDLLAVQETLKSLLQHHSSKASVLSCLYGSTLTSIHDYWKNHNID